WRFAIFSPLPPPPRSSLFPYTTLFRSLPPDAVASFVDEVTNGGLRFVGDGFSKGRIIVRSPEECPLASEEGGDGLVRGELLADPRPPSLHGEGRLVRALEVFDQLRRNFEVFGHRPRLAVVVRAVSSALSHVAVGEPAVEHLVRNRSIGFGIPCPAEIGPHHFCDEGVKVAALTRIEVAPVAKLCPLDKADGAGLGLL